MGVRWKDVDQMILNALGAYQAVDQIKHTRNERGLEQAKRDEEAAAKAKRAEIAAMMAQGPSQTQQAVPTQQSTMLSEQTADMMPEPAIPTAPAAPAGAAPGPQAAIPASPESAAAAAAPPTSTDPDVAAMEADVQASTGRTVLKSEDWASFEENLLKKTAALGDPTAVAEMKEYVNGLKQKGFTENAGKAAAAAATGNDKMVEQFLSRAWGYMDTGTTASVVSVPNKPGVYMVTPVSETESDDQGAPKPAGQPIAMDAAMIGSLAQMTSDPGKFWQLQKQFEQQETSTEVQKTRVELEKQRLGTPEQAAEDRALKVREAEAKTKKAEADAKIAEAKVGKGGEWNDTENRALNNDVNRYIEQVKNSASDEVFDLYDTKGKQIASDAISIVKSLKDYDVPFALGVAEKIAAVPGAQLAIDPDTKEAYVLVGDIEYNLDEI